MHTSQQPEQHKQTSLNIRVETSEQVPTLPVAYFGMAVGTLAFSQTWRVAERAIRFPWEFSAYLGAIGLAIWSVLLLAYVGKWLFHTGLAKQEMQHPLQSSLAALGPISSLLAAIVVQPWSRTLGLPILLFALAWQTLLGFWIYGRFWKGGRVPDSISAAIYLPAVAQNFVAGLAVTAYGWQELGSLLFGAGFFSWLALESMIVSRAALHTPIASEQRPLLGIQMAPAVVAGLTYTSLRPENADMFALMLLGYGLYQFALLLRLLPWILHQAFAPSYWSFSFGIAALANLALRIAEHTQTELMRMLSYGLLTIASVVILSLLSGTACLIWQRKFVVFVHYVPQQKSH